MGCEAIYIGDRTLLRYLTGDPSAPYDEGTAVVVTTEGGETGSVEIRYHGAEADRPPLTGTIPAITVRPADPRVGGVFLPADAVRGLGVRLEPDHLIIDPSLHRTSAAERERIEHRLEEAGFTYVERGYRTPTGWRYAVAVLLLLALAGALIAAREAGSERVLLRISGGSATPSRTLRSLVASRAACGTVLGVSAGCVIGLLLAWPMTTSYDWDPPPRVSFETPWALIAAMAAGLPALAAVSAAVLPPRWTIRTDLPAG
ncbi:hypothetical protein ACFOWE_32485 [Planomonospora corallina]|uniref:FtsX-like permease family protein n=1 Tax=Planomonospora corallina TaxID=1806052 RepID=A0ABV8IFY4_9ACTN